MRYLVFPTEAAAQSTIDLIDMRGRECFSQAGYTVLEDGSVVGRTEGEDNPIGITTTWDIPTPRPDGTWRVTHPEHHPMADYVLPSGRTVLHYTMAGIDADIVDANPSESYDITGGP